MDQLLNRAWRAGDPPFDGVSLRAEDVPLAALAPLLAGVVACLHARFGDRRLWRVEDWHAHDGWVTDRRASGWEELAETCASSDTLAARAALDEFVMLAYYSDPPGLLVRFAVEEYPEPRRERMGCFDVTLPRTEETLIDSALRNLGCARAPAKSYFDETFAG